MIPGFYLATFVQIHSPPGGLQTNSVIHGPAPHKPHQILGSLECTPTIPKGMHSGCTWTIGLVSLLGQMIEAISSLVRCSFLCWFTMGLLNTQGLPGACCRGDWSDYDDNDRNEGG